ncbi:MAG: non-homologous end-joining DNA ligase [Bryobacteraceae bacterium]|nr:non-homologous end-joining DNA ligase [Bryobacteraceae bacterium]
MPAKQVVDIEGRRVELSNLDKLLYPAAGFTKAHVIDYYVRIAPWLLPHLKDRPVTLKRYPDGVAASHFYEKDAPGFTPPWVKTFPVPRRRGGKDIRYILINDLATLVWCANLANLELHPFLHTAPHIDQPGSVVFDLDPGEGMGLRECLPVAGWLRERFDDFGLQAFAKVSGSRGMQIYVPLNSGATYDVTQPFAKGIAELMAREHPELVVSEMGKDQRKGRIFIDWSQNSDFKTTAGVYSLRAKRTHPFVSAPVRWEELDAQHDLTFSPAEALERAERLGDLFAPVLTLRQELTPRRAPPAASKPAREKPAAALATRSSRQGGRRKFSVSGRELRIDMPAREQLLRLAAPEPPAEGVVEIIDGGIESGAMDVHFESGVLQGRARLERQGDHWSLHLGVSEALPFVEPMQALLASSLPEGAEWLYEVKLDGFRALATRDGLLSRKGKQLGRKFPGVERACRLLPEGTMVDGEIVSLDEHGRPAFQRLGEPGLTTVYYLFDLLYWRGAVLCARPLHERRTMLQTALAEATDPLRVLGPVEGGGAQVLAAARKAGIEGIVAKRRQSVYEAGRRSGAWTKVKTNQGQEMVVGGYYPGGAGFGALLVGYCEGDKLLYAAKVRAGFVGHAKRDVALRLAPLRTNVCPFANLPERTAGRWGEGITEEKMRDCQWVRPEVVIQVEFTEWTSTAHLRHVTFAGLREDKDPREVVREDRSTS